VNIALGPWLRVAVDVVFDCNTHLRSIVSPYGPAAACFSLLGTEALNVFVSRDVLQEVENVLSRPVLRQKFPLLTEDSKNSHLQRLHQEAVFIHNVPETFRYSRDPDDEIYVNLALITNARYLVTYDKDLLDLMTAETDAAHDFRHRFPHLEIVDPLAFLEALGVAQERAS